MIFNSPSPPITVPELSWGDYFRSCIDEFGDKPALVDAISERSLSFAELHRAINVVAAALQQRAYQKGDVLAIYAPNSIEFVIAFQAVLSFGGVVTTVNPLYTRDELAHQLTHSKAACLFTTSVLADVARAAAETTGVREIHIFDQTDGTGSFSSLMNDGTAASTTKVEVGADDLAVLPYSSGTTGLPKGVILSHRNLVAHNLQTMNQVDATMPCREDRMIAVIPFFHVFGMTVVMNLGLTRGATVVILPRFDPALFLETIQKYRITCAYLAPPIVNFLALHPLVDNYDLSSLNYILSGAAPLGAQQANTASRRLECTVVQGYGLTEMSPVTHVYPDLSGTVNRASIGTLIPGTEAMIVDTASGEPVGTGEPGELLLRGPQRMREYLNDPQATAETIDADGWLHTGDVAYVDDEGLFYIVDRVKELIKYKGYQVAPAELESLLLTHPAVADAAVVPVADREAGEIPKAFLVCTQEISADVIIDWVAEQVAPYKRIRRIAFIEAIPKSPTGKILRRMLKGP